MGRLESSCLCVGKTYAGEVCTLAAPAFFNTPEQSQRGDEQPPPTEMELSVCNRSEEAGPSRKKLEVLSGSSPHSRLLPPRSYR